jgi:hypothetical protein
VNYLTPDYRNVECKPAGFLLSNPAFNLNSEMKNKIISGAFLEDLPLLAARTDIMLAHLLNQQEHVTMAYELCEPRNLSVEIRKHLENYCKKEIDRWNSGGIKRVIFIRPLILKIEKY